MLLDWNAISRSIEDKVRPHIGSGQVADYIPALACVDPNKFGLAVATGEGRIHLLGDAEEAFSIQSISKVFTLSAALQKVGSALWHRVGREPSGSAFNSIVQLESERGMPRNPLINSGAIVVTDQLIENEDADAAVADLLSRIRLLADDVSVDVDAEVAASESKAGARNRALAYFMAGFGHLRNPVEICLAAYFQHCAIRMSCSQLARAALFLAFDGIDPVTGNKIITAERCRRINAVMMSCGHYDNSGDFAYRIGLPGKSGVGGGILAVVPGVGTIATWSPGLNRSGTSTVGSKALEELVRLTGWSVFV